MKPEGSAAISLPLEPDPPRKYNIINQDEDLRKLMEFLPRDIQAQIRGDLHDLEELKIRLGRPLYLLLSGQKYRATELMITMDHLQFIASKCKTFRDDNRRGIDGTGHRISQVVQNKAAIGYTFRVGRYFEGFGEPFRPYIEENPSFLLVGMAGTGKTTTLRGLISIVAEYYPMQTVGVDTSGEMGGSGKIPHIGIGQADIMPVESKSQQALIIEEAVKNQNPRVLVVDEINRLAEAEAIAVGHKVGAQLIGTTHGANLEEVLANPNLQPLFSPVPIFYWLVITERRGLYSIYNAQEATCALASGRRPVGKPVYL